MGAEGLVVAVTGPTGEIGRSFLRALEAAEGVSEIRGMARRPFDPAAHGWHRTTYVQGDVLDASAVEDFVAGADVVVHLAFLIFGSAAESRTVNLTGSGNVFDAAVSAGVKRLAYTSSVAAYGFHEDAELPLTEDSGPRGSEGFYYSAQKAELEATLEDALAGSEVESYVFRPSIVGGPDSPALVANMPYVGAPALLRGPLRSLVDRLPAAHPVLLDPGVPMQLVHADDVASALVLAVLGAGPRGVYNLAADGEFTVSDLAKELGWHCLPVPGAAVDLTAELLERLPAMPTQASWIQAARVPVVMDTSRARSELGWAPLHDALATLAATVDGARRSGLIDRAGRLAP